MDHFPQEILIIGQRQTWEVHEPPNIHLIENAGKDLTFKGVISAYYFHMSIDGGNLFLGVGFSIKLHQ